MISTITIPLFTCNRCKKQWCPRHPLNKRNRGHVPKQCPKCKNPNWNVPRGGKRRGGGKVVEKLIGYRPFGVPFAGGV